MNKLFFCLSLISIYGLQSCNQISEFTNKNREVSSIDTILYQNETEIVFKDTFKDLGNIKEGVVSKIIYHFTNTGKFPLIIKSVKPSCGCTIASFNEKPIEVGQSDSIIANFDSDGRLGSHQKSIKVSTNTYPMIRDLIFKVNVIK